MFITIFVSLYFKFSKIKIMDIIQFLHLVGLLYLPQLNETTNMSLMMNWGTQFLIVMGYWNQFLILIHSMIWVNTLLCMLELIVTIHGLTIDNIFNKCTHSNMYYMLCLQYCSYFFILLNIILISFVKIFTMASSSSSDDEGNGVTHARRV